MFYRDRGFSYERKYKRRRVLRTACVILILFTAAGAFLFLPGRTGGVSQKEITAKWKNGDYAGVFRLSDTALKDNPDDFFFLMTNGIAAYQISRTQVNNADILSYTDRAVWALRRALLTQRGREDPRIKYVLGKAYYYKGPFYADLCIKYLEEARKAGYKAEDIPQFLGLAYASVRDYRNSAAAFSEALTEPDAENSDTLLLAIARSYIELGEDDTALPYLVRVSEISKDWPIIRTAGILRSGILIRKGDFEAAKAGLLTLLNEGGENAEVCFELGELYNARNDRARARAEWRRSAKLDPSFTPPRERLGL